MDLEFGDTQQLIQKTARDFAQRQVAPVAKELDQQSRWPAELVKQLGQLGLMGVAIPEEYGGAGADYISYALAMEEISAACASVGVIMSVNNSLVCEPLLKFGNEEQKKTYLHAVASGQQIGCFGLTEPSSGSDAQHMETIATKKADRWILNGSKNWITNGPHADFIIVFATTTKDEEKPKTSAFIVPRGTAGFRTEVADHKLGISAAHSCTVFFEDCELSGDYLLGQEGQGFKIAMSTLDVGRIGIAAQALGIARTAYEKAVAYSKERKAFGKLLAELQAIQFKIADMAVDIDAARLLVHHAAWIKDQSKRHTMESAVCKLFASEMATRVTHQAMQVFGGYGYSKEYDLERHYRDARITEIYEGTSEIMRLVIAAQELKD